MHFQAASDSTFPKETYTAKFLTQSQQDKLKSPLSIYRVDQILALFHEKGSRYPSHEEFRLLFHRLHVDGRMQRSLVRTARRLLAEQKLRLPKNYRYTIAKHVEEAIKVTQETKEHLHLPNISRQLGKEFGISATLLNAKVRDEYERQIRRTVPDSTKREIRMHLSRPGSENISVTQLCDELGQNITLPRRVLYDLISLEKIRLQRRTLTRQQRLHIRKFVRDQAEQEMKHSDSDKNDGNDLLNALTQRLSSQLSDQTATSIHKSLLFDLVREELLKLNRNTVTQNQKDVVRKEVEQYLSAHTQNHHSPMLKDLQSVHRSLSEKLKLPKRIISNLLAQELRRRRENVSQEHRALIREHIHSLDDTDVSDPKTLCDELEQKMHLPRTDLLPIIHEELVKAARQSLSPSDRKSIRAFIASSNPGEEPNYNISDTCDRLVKTLSIEAPRPLIYQVVRDEMVKQIHKDKQLRASIQTAFERAVQHSDIKTVSASSMCDQLEAQFPQLPRYILYGLIRNQVVQRKRREISDELRDKVRQYVSEHVTDTAQSIPLLIENMMKDMDLDVQKRIIYPIVRRELLLIERRSITKELRRRIRELVAAKCESSSFTVAELCEFVTKELGGIAVPQRALSEIVAREARKYAVHHIAQEEKEAVIEQVRRRSDSNNLVEALHEGEYSHIPKDTLKQLVKLAGQ